MWHTPIGTRVLDNTGLERSIYRQLLSELMGKHSTKDLFSPGGLPAMLAG